MFKKTGLAAMAAMLAFPSLPVDAASKSKKDVRSTMTEEQKRELRKRGREWCERRYGKHANIISVQILSDGTVRCFISE